MSASMSTLDEIIALTGESAASEMILDTSWVVPLVQTIHLVAIAVVVGSVLVTELRFAGLLATDEASSTVARRYLPWLWGALAVLLISGAILVVGEPQRSLNNKVFWLKMLLVLCGFGISFVLRRPWLVDSSERAFPGLLDKSAALLSLCIWIAIIFSGRWIAYTS